MSMVDHSFSTVQRWEDAGASLTTALNGYKDMCLGLEADLSPQGAQLKDLVYKIDSSLEMVRIRLSQVLQESGSVLARIRNRLAPTLHNFPQEVLMDIFLTFVFDRGSSKESQRQSMSQGVKLIYHRLYTLIGVCTTWRDIVISRGVFWSVIPMVVSTPNDKLQPFELSLQRASGSRLYLAAGHLTGIPGTELTAVLASHGPRFSTVNISSFSLPEIQDAISGLLQQKPLGSLRELFIHNCTDMSFWDNQMPQDDQYIVPHDHPEHASFASLIKVLAIFRTCGVHVHWNTISFSNLLVELRVEKIILGYDNSIISFGQALSSAPSLRDLSIISVITFRNRHSTQDSKLVASLLASVKLPALQSLHIQDVHLNTLEHLLPMIARGPYHISFLFSPSCLSIKTLGGELIDPTAFNALCNVIRHTSIDTLMVDGYSHAPELMMPQLGELFNSTPTLKTLKAHHCYFDTLLCEALTRTRNAPSPGPALQNLQLTSARIVDERDFQDMVASHPLQSMTLAGTLSADYELGGGNTIQEGSSVMMWIKENMPGLELHLVEDEHYPPEFMESITWFDSWPLW